MAYKVVLSNRCSKKLISICLFLEKDFSKEVARDFLDRIDLKMALLSKQPDLGIASHKVPAVHRISITKYHKLYYRIKGRKIIMLDLFKQSENMNQKAG